MYAEPEREEELHEEDGFDFLFPADDGGEGDERLRPYRRLACAVILQALRDLGRSGALAGEAMSWFFMRDHEPSLRWWCELADTTVEKVRTAAQLRILARVTGYRHLVDQRAR